jgi:hypothetical protein
MVGGEVKTDTMPSRSSIIDDLSQEPPHSSIGTDWRLFTDQVMGGLSQGSMARDNIAGRPAIHMQGNVSLENNGGFIQISLDLAPDGETFDATGWLGFEIDVYGKSDEYDFRLRTSELGQPWQSYRQSFVAEPHWKTVRLPFDQFKPHRIDKPLNLRLLRRLGLVAFGRAFSADLALGGIRLFA